MEICINGKIIDFSGPKLSFMLYRVFGSEKWAITVLLHINFPTQLCIKCMLLIAITVCRSLLPHRVRSSDNDYCATLQTRTEWQWLGISTYDKWVSETNERNVPVTNYLLVTGDCICVFTVSGRSRSRLLHKLKSIYDFLLVT